MPDPFATAGELAQYLGNNEPTDLARYQQHLRAASALIRGYCRQELSRHVDDVVLLEPTYSNRQFLPEVPVTAISSITVNAVAFTDFGFTDQGLIYRNDSLAWSEVATVTYTHGYAEFSNEYEEIKRICIEVAARSITHNRDGTAQAMGGTLVDSAGYSPETFLTPQERWQLGGLALVGVG